MTGAPALRSASAAWAHEGQRISKRATSHRKGRSRTSARLAPSLVRQERAMIEPPRPTHNSPERVGHVAVDTRSDRTVHEATSSSSFPTRHFAADLASCSSVARSCAADPLLLCTIVRSQSACAENCRSSSFHRVYLPGWRRDNAGQAFVTFVALHHAAGAGGACLVDRVRPGPRPPRATRAHAASASRGREPRFALGRSQCSRSSRTGGAAGRVPTSTGITGKPWLIFPSWFVMT